MFETILEKILLKYLGEYLSGLNSSNLHIGVLKGDILIENVTIRPEVIEKLDLPLKMIYSNIGKMQVRIPWTSLSSQPVEICLQDILVVLSIQQPSAWDFSKANAINRKFEILLNYASSYYTLLKDFSGDEKKKEQAPGYLGTICSLLTTRPALHQGDGQYLARD